MRLLAPIFMLLIIAGCQNKPDNRSATPNRTEAELIELNKSLITRDRTVITEYINSSERIYNETNTGLWYSVLTEGTGGTAKTGNNVTFDFECTLLNGNPCYSGTQTIKVGYSETERGVTEGLQLMQEGSDYMFILPPYLAFGHTGDGDRIPGRAILIYRIRIKEIS